MEADTTTIQSLVTVTYSGRLAAVELNRPESINALNLDLLRELVLTLKDLTVNEQVDIVVLKGKGKGFCSGGDIKSMLALSDESDFFAMMDIITELSMTLYCMPKLTLCAVHGAAAGLGLTIALACDHIIADSKSKIAMNFIGIGLIPDGGGHFFLERRLGEVKAKELIWEGKVLTANEAIEKRLIHESTDNLEAAVKQKINEWKQKPVAAMIKTKKILAENNRPNLLKILELEKHGQLKMRRTQDHLEGIQAFVEKRKPKFTGN
ncbi:enoyl-CoA hydratase/carnithine racemase [Peribacillus deserti]|uniref:Enoyl-CoA hydratase/carnithine racemase n=1 Tax=Peribacillus deserti TaxID=673318 RepID=A0ABS2QLV8_9BACI|nr:enoyl-CoA hydratase [Peribacillus deserti]MBM7694160.1 enoyl-CoA hydratase/carnithine racemase [Peribacillus deserti]